MNCRILLFGIPKERCREMIEPSTVLEARGFGEELPYLEGDFFGHIAAHNVIQFTVEAEKEGFDAVVIGCCLDHGMREARELVKMPVIGVGEATLHLACMLSAGKFSVLLPRRKGVSRMADVARMYGLDSRVASWRILDLSVQDMLHDREKTEGAMLREAKAAVLEDGAEVICLGCTAMVGLAKRLQDELVVPVLDPILVGLKMAELQAALWRRFGISHSKIGGYESLPLNDVANGFNASYGVVRKVLYHFKNKQQ